MRYFIFFQNAKNIKCLSKSTSRPETSLKIKFPSNHRGKQPDGIHCSCSSDQPLTPWLKGTVAFKSSAPYSATYRGSSCGQSSLRVEPKSVSKIARAFRQGKGAQLRSSLRSSVRSRLIEHCTGHSSKNLWALTPARNDFYVDSELLSNPRILSSAQWSRTFRSTIK